MNPISPAHLLSVLVVAAAGAIAADEPRTQVTLDMPTAMAQTCKTEKCVVMTANQAFDAIDHAYKLGRREALEEAEDEVDSNGCKKGKT